MDIHDPASVAAATRLVADEQMGSQTIEAPAISMVLGDEMITGGNLQATRSCAGCEWVPEIKLYLLSAPKITLAEFWSEGIRFDGEVRQEGAGHFDVLSLQQLANFIVTIPIMTKIDAIRSGLTISGKVRTNYDEKVITFEPAYVAGFAMGLEAAGVHVKK